MARKRAALEMNDEIITNSQSDNPSAYLKSAHDEKLIAKRVAAIRRQVRRKRAKYISQQHFLAALGRGVQSLFHMVLLYDYVWPGTVVDCQLNARGLAQVTSRRARKGFQLKVNPDTGVLPFTGTLLCCSTQMLQTSSQ